MSRHAARARATRGRGPQLLAVAAAVVAVVAAGTLVERRDALDPAAGEVVAATLAPLAPPSTAAGSTAYCAGGTGSEGGAEHRVHLANPGDEPVDVSVTVVPGALRGETLTAVPEAVDLDVPPGRSVVVELASVVDAPYLSAIVESGPGELAVEHSIEHSGEGAAGVSLAPCASTSSATWHVASGVTTRDALEELALFNPFPDDAVVDISLTTPDGQRVPAAFAGLIIPGRRVVVIDVGAVVSRHPIVSASVTARTGRLVVDRIQRFDGSDGPAGLALTPAAPAASLVWELPDGAVAEGDVEVVTVYNPTDTPAEVDVEVALEPSSDPAQPIAAEPFALSVAPLDFAQVEVHADGRVPAGRGHAITVRSQNGVGVVAERWVRGAEAGLSATLGSPVVSTRWLGTVGARGAADTSLVVANLGAEPARVAVSSPDPAVAAALAAIGEVEVPPVGRAVVDLGDLRDLDTEAAGGVVIVVQGAAPLVVERVERFEAGISRSILLAGAATAAVAPAEAVIVG